MSRPLVSIVIPVLNEAGQLDRTQQVLADVLAGCDVDYELIIVDDGSTDATWGKLCELSARVGFVRGVRLSRNFGKEAALCAGLDAVRGDACIIMDADLQHPPSLIPDMLRLWREQGYPIVEAFKRRRGDEGAVTRLGAKLFYWSMKRVSRLDLESASDFKLLDGRIVSIWRGLHERETFFRGLTAWVGFPRAKVFFDVPPREGGKSRWSHWRLAKLAVSALTSFSAVPLQLVTTLGVLFLLGAIPMGLQTLYMKFSGRAVSGFTTVITLQLIIGSILMISLGVIGTYLARVFEEVKQRPRYIVSETSPAPSPRPATPTKQC